MQNGTLGIYVHSLLPAAHGFVFYLVSFEIDFKTRLFTLVLLCSPPLLHWWGRKSSSRAFEDGQMYIPGNGQLRLTAEWIQCSKLFPRDMCADTGCNESKMEREKKDFFFKPRLEEHYQHGFWLICL